MSLPWLEAVEAEFAERLRGGRLAHALLLSGPRDCGKTDLARRFLAAVLCLEDRYPACGACRSCQLLASGAHPDGHVMTISPHPKTGKMRTMIVVDQIRDLTASLFLTNTISKRKGAVIHPAEESNASALNALLKTLEEPPSDTVIILVSHNTGRLPATVRSRCQNLVVRLPEHGQAVAWTMAQTGISGDDAEAALEAAAGSPLRAVQIARDGDLARFQVLREQLDGLRGGRSDPVTAQGKIGDLDNETLWSWISLHAAEVGRRGAAQGLPGREVLELQRQADVNRVIARSPVRNDLLLRDWLIQWARLGV
jgi:DNA polymerase-3 subunit delta'